MSDGIKYVIKTDLRPVDVTRVGVELFLKWMEFALGRGSLDGKRLVYPTGRYASSLRFEQRDEATVAIVADEAIAPEALWLEVGHGEFDLKKMAPSLSGRGIPMHRPLAAAVLSPGAAMAHFKATGVRRIGAGPARPSMWAEVRAAGGSGYASFGPDSDPDSWIIPAMPAYAPAHVLAQIAARQAAAAGGA